MNILHIIIPTVRNKFIGKIVESIYSCEPHELEIRLHLMFQSNPRHILGLAFDKVNEATDMISSGWIWTISDEDKINPKLFKRLSELIKQYPDKECFVFSLMAKTPEDRIYRANPFSVEPCEIGGCQYVIKRELIGNLRHDYQNFGDNADGEFIKRIFERNPEKFMFIDEVLITFDEYTWKEPV